MDIASAGSSEAVSTPRVADGLRRGWVNGPPAVAIGLVVVQLMVRGWLAGRGYFYWDDLILAGRSGRLPLFSANLLLYDHDGHFMPAAFAVAWVITRLGPYLWAGPVLSMLVLQLLASAAVLRMLLALTSPEYGSGRDAGRGLRERAAAMARSTRWTLLIPLAFYLFCPLTLPAFAWWSAALNALPLQIALAWVVGDAVLLIRTGRGRYALSGCVVLAAALLFFEKSVIVPFVAFVAAGLIRYVDGGEHAIRTVARRGARLWVGAAAVLICWGAIYLTVVHVSAVRSTPAGVRALLDHAISRGIVPALVGGPWRWERWVPSTPWAAAPVWAVVLAWLIIGALVVYSIRTRRRVWPVWVAVVVYVLAAQLPVALIRGGPYTTDELTQSLRYLADLAVPLTVAGALLLRAGPRRVVRRGVRPPIAVALVAAFVASSLWSTITFSRSWSVSPTRVYLTTVKSELAAGGPPLLEQEVPWKVLNPLAYPLNRISVVLSPLAPPNMFAHATPRLRMITDEGRIVDAAVWWNRGIRRGPVRGCGYAISGTQPVPVPLDGPMIDNAWTAQLNYLAGRDGRITVALEHGETVVAPVREGLNTVYVRVIGGGTLLRIGVATPGLHVCLGAGPVGVASYSH
ncbi:hypothetical protein [Nocardia vaccinii]|uniref:hypothetical protein n=1 Tax=Nocardia vaccinii TaxID=1822 RepID=UPI000B2AD9E7|nr:hypothetical protein [Nocardia vaccinii]